MKNTFLSNLPQINETFRPIKMKFYWQSSLQKKKYQLGFCHREKIQICQYSPLSLCLQVNVA